MRALIKEREPAYRQLKDYVEPATTLAAAVAAEDGRVLLRAKAKAAVLVPPLTLTANALEVVSDVGAAAAVGSEAAAAAAEAFAVAAAAGAESISALGPLTDYPVFTMQPREDGWNDARDLIKVSNSGPGPDHGPNPGPTPEPWPYPRTLAPARTLTPNSQPQA